MKNNELEDNEKKNDNTIKLIDNLTENDINAYIRDNLQNYLSNALRITHYYGNLRIKYVGFNFTLTAFYISTIGILISIVLRMDPSLLWGVLPLGIGFLSYIINLSILVSKEYATITFHHSNLQHYDVLMKEDQYPNIPDKELGDFIKLIKKENKNYSIVDDLKALIKQYLYQINYNRLARRLRKWLIAGLLIFSLTLAITLILFTIL